jgi:SOS-response transcriptional repressor LexA
MKKIDSAYYGVLPTPIRHHKELKPNHKLLYSEITACLDSNGVCTRNNSYFSKVLNISKSTISTFLGALRKHGFIKITIENEEGTMRFLNRYITLTHSSYEVGVSDSNKTPHTSNKIGVDNDHPRKDVETPISNDETLLYNNNIIKTIYTNHQAKNTPIKKEINDKQRIALLEIVKEFYGTQRTRFPNMINEKWVNESSIVNGSINVLYDLIKKDGFNYDEIQNIIRWALNDKFWGKNLLSLKVLRDKAVNGFTKFQNLHHNFNQQ